MDTEVFNTSVDISSISNHSALHDNRMFLAILNFLNCYEQHVRMYVCRCSRV